MNAFYVVKDKTVQIFGIWYITFDNLLMDLLKVYSPINHNNNQKDRYMQEENGESESSLPPCWRSSLDGIVAVGHAWSDMINQEALTLSFSLCLN